MIDSGQIRAARALLGWSQTQLGEQAGISQIALSNIEKGSSVPRANNLAAIQDALEQAGVIFLASGDTTSGGVGVRLKNE